MAAQYPTFFFEANHSQAYQYDIGPQTTGLMRIWNHNLWKLPNVIPEIAIDVTDSFATVYNTNTTGLASGFVHEYLFHKNMFANSGNVTLSRYSFKIKALGTRRTTQTYQFLFSNQKDLTSGGGPSGSIPTNANYLVPWATSGIAYYTHATGFYPFWAELKKNMQANGIGNPEVLAITSENLGDDTLGMVLGGTGWVDNALADPRSTGINFTIDGNRTFRQFWDSVTGWYDGTTIPTGVTNSDAYAPEDNKIRQKWQAARLIGMTYATKKGIIEPMQASLGNVPVVEYAIFGANNLGPADDTYPGSKRNLVDVYFDTWQGPDFYGKYPAFHNAKEDNIPPYWDSDYGWQHTYDVTLDPASSLSAQEYASYKWAISRLVQPLISFPDKPVCPWLSLYSQSANSDTLLAIVKYCYLNGVRQFYVWENSYMGAVAENDAWYSFIQRVNAWVDTLQGATAYNASTVCKFGGGFYKR